MVTFTAHLSETIKRLTRYKQKVVVAAMLEGKSMPSNMAANANLSASSLLFVASSIQHSQHIAVCDIRDIVFVACSYKLHIAP